MAVYKDTYAEHPDDRINYKYYIQFEEKYGGVLSLQGMMDFLGLKSVAEMRRWPAIEYHRLPCADEKALPMEYFDEVVDLVCKHYCDEHPAAIIFSCQMGKGRTTTGQVVATIIFHVLRGKPVPAETEHMLLHPAVEEICLSVSGGRDAVALADMAIDMCDQMQNLRECVTWAWTRYGDECQADKMLFWRSMAENFVQRYCFLVLFAAYCLQCGRAPYRFRQPGVPFESFSDFIIAQPLLLGRLAYLQTKCMGEDSDDESSPHKIL
jgi:hypothetical protein